MEGPPESVRLFVKCFLYCLNSDTISEKKNETLNFSLVFEA